MKTRILMVALAAGMTLTAFDAAAFGGHGGGMQRPDFATLDADGNGQLTLEEMQQAGANRFASADTNGDGALSEQELTAAAQGRMAKRIGKMIERFDENGDGLLQADEMPKPREGRHAGRMAEAFADADANGDGALSAEEFAEMGPRGKRGGPRHGNGGN